MGGINRVSAAILIHFAHGKIKVVARDHAGRNVGTVAAMGVKRARARVKQTIGTRKPMAVRLEKRKLGIRARLQVFHGFLVVAGLGHVEPLRKAVFFRCHLTHKLVKLDFAQPGVRGVATLHLPPVFVKLWRLILVQHIHECALSLLVARFHVAPVAVRLQLIETIDDE